MEILFDVTSLKKHFSVSTGFLSRFIGKPPLLLAVDGVTFHIKRGELLGIVGESGCGKSTIARLILLLMKPTEGAIRFAGGDISSLDRESLLGFRKSAQMIFQDAQTSLNRNKTVGKIIADPMEVHRLYCRKEIVEKVKELLDLVGLSPRHIHRYPHEFSGGQKQRICIARALALNPRFIVADEPVSSLDVSAQAQIINLLIDLQGKYGLTYLFISHNLALMNQISDRVIVMYLGKFVEIGASQKLFANPLHPYTQSLLDAVLSPDPGQRKERYLLEGEVPNPMNPPPGCRFHPRCKRKLAKCAKEQAEAIQIEDDHWVACHLYC